jgi:hypothetical protein
MDVVRRTPLLRRRFDCPPLDTPFLAAPVAHQGGLPSSLGASSLHDDKTTAEVHDLTP